MDTPVISGIAGLFDGAIVPEDVDGPRKHTTYPAPSDTPRSPPIIVDPKPPLSMRGPKPRVEAPSLSRSFSVSSWMSADVFSFGTSGAACTIGAGWRKKHMLTVLVVFVGE